MLLFPLTLSDLFPEFTLYENTIGKSTDPIGSDVFHLHFVTQPGYYLPSFNRSFDITGSTYRGAPYKLTVDLIQICSLILSPIPNLQDRHLAVNDPTVFDPYTSVFSDLKGASSICSLKSCFESYTKVQNHPDPDLVVENQPCLSGLNIPTG